MPFWFHFFFVQKLFVFFTQSDKFWGNGFAVEDGIHEAIKGKSIKRKFNLLWLRRQKLFIWPFLPLSWLKFIIYLLQLVHFHICFRWFTLLFLQLINILKIIFLFIFNQILGQLRQLVFWDDLSFSRNRLFVHTEHHFARVFRFII